MVKRWDEQSQAYVEPLNVPMRYDEDSQAYVETTGMVWDAESQAYSEVWGQKVSAYVYGAVSETVTIKKNGIIIATVATNSDGVSDEQIDLAYGTYTLTGSVSGWTEEQAVDKDTTKFRAMPEGALYWYGNECTLVAGGWGLSGFSTSGYTASAGTKYQNHMTVKGNGSGTVEVLATTNLIDTNKYSKIVVNEKCTFRLYKGKNIAADIEVQGESDGNIATIQLASYRDKYYVACMAFNDSTSKSINYVCFDIE